MYVSYSTKPFFFAGSNFGYTVMVNYHDFDMTKQESGNDKFADFGIAQWDPIGIQLFYASPRVYGDGYDARVAGASIRSTSDGSGGSMKIITKADCRSIRSA